MKLYSYVVDHDTGVAPNPDGGLCTLCLCKFRERPEGKRNIVEMANEGDWVIGTGGVSKRSTGHRTLVYAMRVDEKPTREEYYRRFRKTRVDSKPPNFNGQFALISRHFYYFGANAIDIPKTFKLEKKGPGYRCDFKQADIYRFVEWLDGQKKRGKCGEPCAPKSSEKPKGSKKCKSPC
ncbi:MAG: hypothetical protein ACLPX7_26365 [Xanthobacteraceae bacterium]